MSTYLLLFPFSLHVPLFVSKFAFFSFNFRRRWHWLLLECSVCVCVCNAPCMMPSLLNLYILNSFHVNENMHSYAIFTLLSQEYGWWWRMVLALFLSLLISSRPYSTFHIRTQTMEKYPHWIMNNIRGIKEARWIHICTMNPLHTLEIRFYVDVSNFTILHTNWIHLAISVRWRK